MSQNYSQESGSNVARISVSFVKWPKPDGFIAMKMCHFKHHKETPDSIYKIIDTFSNATPHVPVHRRETVFQSLMVTCGVTESLHIGWLTLAVKHVVAQRGDNIQDPTDYFDLMTSLIGRFSVREIIDSSVKMASYLSQIKFKMTPDDLKKDKILDTNMTQDDIINFHYFINFFMYRLYSSHDFIHGQLARITEEEELNLNEAYGTLLNKLLQYTEVRFRDRKSAILKIFLAPSQFARKRQ